MHRRVEYLSHEMHDLNSASEEADPGTEGRGVHADRGRRSNLVGRQAGALDDWECAVRIGRGGLPVDISGSDEPWPPEADAVAPGEEPVAGIIGAVGGAGKGRERGIGPRDAVAGEAVAGAV